MTTTTTDAATTANEPIDWLIDVLRGADQSIVVTRRDAPVGNVELERYTVFPSENDPRLIITATSSRVRAAALRRIGAQTSPAMKWIRLVGAELARTGLDQLVAGPDVVLSVEADRVDEAPGDRRPMTLVEYLESALDTRGLHIAATTGPLRPNRKPVLQIMNADGDLLAYAKVGWNVSTGKMVETESVVLSSLSQQRFIDVIVPEVLHFGTWRDLAILVTSPLEVDPADGAPPSDQLAAAALREIGNHAAVAPSTVRSSNWLSSIGDRAWGSDGRNKELSQLVEMLGNVHGETSLAFGFSHGDWAPWNMARIGSRLGVWDWERASPDVPLGLDVVHFHFQQEFHANGNDVERAIDSVQPAVVDGLTRLHANPDDARLISAMYLIELALRYAESSMADDPDLNRVQMSLTSLLRRRIEDLEASTPRPTATPEARSGGVFKRRMLGGAGLPAPVRDAVKTTVKSWGQATSDRRVLPNTFIVGGQRCGTTSLFRYLTQHRSVTGPMLEKGVHYFDTGYTGDLDWYRGHFPTVRAARLSRQRNGSDLRVVEAAPYYLFHPFVPERIARTIPDARIIALVRDPVARALSHHNHEVKRGFEVESFERALELEKERLDGEVDKMAADPTYVSYAHQHHSYVSRGFYEDQLERYDHLFGEDNVLVLRTSDLEREPESTVERALLFLGVPVLGNIKFPKFNVRAYSAMESETEQELREVFAGTDAAMAARLGRAEAWN